MKRRYPGDQTGSSGPPGPTFPGRLRPNDPRFSGRGGPPNVQRGGGPRPPLNMGFRGRGGPGPSMSGRGRDRHNIPGGRGAPYGNFQGRGPLGRGVNGPPIRGRENMMGRGNNMMGRGPMAGRPPPMMGRAPPRPGPPISNSGIPPPPPRGPMGHPLPSRDRPPQFHHPPPPRMPPLPMRGRPPPMRMGPPPNNTAQPQFQQRQFQHVAPPSNIPGVVPQFSGNSPNHLQASRPARAGPLTYNNTAAAYSNIPIASAPLATATTQHQSAMRQVASQPGQAAARKPTSNQIDQAWKEYTAPNGVKYYHNAILKESTYTKPITLTKKEATAAAHTQEKRKWQEYEDASTGKTYYSDGVTTTWEMPTGFTTDADEAVQSEEPEPARKKKKSSANPASSFSSKEEAIAAFKGLLLAKGVVPTIKWNEVVKIISSDSRWEGCKDALSVGERRQALAEYQTKRANELRDLERQERIRAKDAFGQLLTDILPSISGFSPLGCRFSDVRSTLAKDGRFHAVATENTRESLFLDFCEELRKRDERKKRSKKREAHDAFLSFLREREEAGKLTFASTWDSFFSSLDEDEKKDERFDISAIATDSDRQLHFADFVIELQAAEDDKRRRIRDARRRAEKAQREAYREVLQKLAAARKITPSTQWRSIEELVFMDESFNLVAAQDRNSPRSLFEEFVGEWDDIYHRERSFLSRLLHQPNKKEIQVKAATPYEEFTKLLLDEASHSQELYGDTRQIINTGEPISSARLYYDELIARAADLSKRGSARRRPGEESSEDEGEIIEDGELEESDDAANKPSE